MTKRRSRTRRSSNNSAIVGTVVGVIALGFVALIVKRLYDLVVSNMDVILDFLLHLGLTIFAAFLGWVIVRALILSIVVAVRQAKLNLSYTGKIHFWRRYDV